MTSRKLNYMAILSFVCCLATFYSELAILPAVVFWLLAMRERKRTSATGGMGYATWALGILMALIVASLFAALLFRVPNEIAAAKVRQELAALNTMRAARDALDAHRRRFGGYPRNVQKLVEQGLLDKSHLDPSAFGYRFDYDVADEIGTGTHLYASFAIFARPKSGLFSHGKRLFYLNKAGVIEIQKSMEAGEQIEQRLPPPPNWSPPSD